MNMRRMVALQVVILLVLVIAGFVGYYFYNQSSTYIKTDDAQVSGQQIVIAAPAAGQLTAWNGSVGSTFSSGSTVGTLAVPTGKGEVNMNIPDPSSSTIVDNLAVKNEYVSAGEPLAYAYNLNDLYVIANIKETDIRHVEVGQNVDVYVDAYPGTTYNGVVKQIDYTTAATLSPLPSSNTNADYTKVTQVIPVEIQLQSDTQGLAPGMNVRVRIHR
ncbi:multidrug resistance protein A [Alicyclobacillus hesperidum]|uniref:Multidrug resistance protein A n=1 Tax=Alicyclobacillus hesperidum TaxID=89784 RepID=A0AA37X3C2_9BACL|nr:HlyD family efflux transporter periplasmic adaptor subunit [Alicyclobacillus hesperidum]GLV14825.1 multidrug resistance protein A [Alicyclobacillus hesperidum]